MCLHRSYVVTEDYRVLSHPRSDHHTEIRRENAIREDGFHYTLRHAAVECQPVDELFDLNGWQFVIDEKRTPDWWTKEHRSAVQKKLEADFMRMAVQDSTYVFPADLDLRNLQLHRENCTIISGGHIILGARFLPPGTTIIAKQGQVLLPNLRHAYPFCTIVAERVKCAMPPQELAGLQIVKPAPRRYPAYRIDEPLDPTVRSIPRAITSCAFNTY